MFSINLYSKINTDDVEKKEGFDDMFFKSIALYQAVAKTMDSSTTEVVIFKDKKLEESIMNSLSKIYKFEDGFFDALFQDLDYILRTNHLKIGEAGILKRRDNNIYIEL